MKVIFEYNCFFFIIILLGNTMIEEQKVLIVDDFDNILGALQKSSAHIEGKLHRAFSIFLINKDENKMLLQKRSVNKYHSGGLWSNSCCSHQYLGETFEDALVRCVTEELGIKTDIKSFYQMGKFKYFSDYGNIKEHEIDHVYIYIADKTLCSKIVPNEQEIEMIKWVSLEDIDSIYKNQKNEFTSWFYDAYKICDLKKNWVNKCFL